MKHKVKMRVETEKQGLFGKRKVLQEQIVEVDSSTYKKMKRKQKQRPLSVDELLFYDEILDDDE